MYAAVKSDTRDLHLPDFFPSEVFRAPQAVCFLHKGICYVSTGFLFNILKDLDGVHYGVLPFYFDVLPFNTDLCNLLSNAGQLKYFLLPDGHIAQGKKLKELCMQYMAADILFQSNLPDVFVWTDSTRSFADDMAVKLGKKADLLVRNVPAMSVIRAWYRATTPGFSHFRSGEAKSQSTASPGAANSEANSKAALPSTPAPTDMAEVAARLAALLPSHPSTSSSAAAAAAAAPYSSDSSVQAQVLSNIWTEPYNPFKYGAGRCRVVMMSGMGMLCLLAYLMLALKQWLLLQWHVCCTQL